MRGENMTEGGGCQCCAFLLFNIKNVPLPVIGMLLLPCVVLDALPRTSVLGAVFLMGYLGGAVARRLRVGDPLFPVLFPVVVGVLVWGVLYLRHVRLLALIP